MGLNLLESNTMHLSAGLSQSHSPQQPLLLFGSENQGVYTGASNITFAAVDALEERLKPEKCDPAAGEANLRRIQFSLEILASTFSGYTLRNPHCA